MSNRRFDLDTALAAWRRSLEHDRAFLADDLDELEQHVRDQVAGLVSGGISEEAAFRKAMVEMGNYAVAEKEYKKVYWGKVKRHHLLFNEMARRFSMLGNYVKIALRNAWRHKGYAFINVFGLAVGLASCLLILLYVQDELHFDAFHQKADRIYRVVNAVEGNDGLSRRATTPSALGPALEAHVPEVEHAVRFFQRTRQLLGHDDRHFVEPQGFLAEPAVFDVFSFPLLEGDAETALARPQTIVLTETLAHKLFDDDDPMGQTVTLNDATTLEVTGVMADVPPQSHLQFSYLVSFGTLRVMMGLPEHWENWSWQDFFTYVLLEQDADPAAVQDDLSAYVAREVTPITERSGFTHGPYLQPLADIHLHSADLQYDVAVVGSYTSVRALSIVAVFVLLIACFNFVNLSTARAAGRAKEVGLRKVVGGFRSQLVRQFLSESFLYVLTGVALALGIVLVALPSFDAFTGKDLTLAALGAPAIVAALVSICLVVTLAAGSYPAFFLSAFKPAQVLKQRVSLFGGGATWIRKGLVILQFTLSTALIIASVFVFQQLRYLHHRDMGFDKERLVILPMRGDVNSDTETFKHELLRNPGVVSVTAARGVPGDVVPGDAVEVPGRDKPFFTRMLLVDDDYVRTMKMHLAAGRAFSADEPTDAASAFMLNETAARQLGWTPEEAVGKDMVWGEWGFDPKVRKGRVVGVLRDFNFASLREAVEPTVLTIFPAAYSHLVIRIRPDDIPGTLRSIERTWKTAAGDWPFRYAFLDDQFNRFYQADARLGRLLSIFSALAVIVACLGLFGLATDAAERRTKEIGIRKVLGATVPGIVASFARDFLRLVLMAFVVAVPLSYVVARRWLDGFAYRIDIGWQTFVWVGVLALLVAFLTVSYHASRAAMADPVRSLRYE